MAQSRSPEPADTAFWGLGRKPVYFAAAGLAASIAAVLIAISTIGGGGGGKTNAAQLPGAAEARALFRGIPQHGTGLGSAKAPVTLVEYADLQCPYCAEWARRTLPAVVRDFVRPGRVRIDFRGLAFIGSDSTTALAAALPAGRQGKLWQTVDLLYTNQGAENSGWVNEELLHSVSAAVGLKHARFDADRESSSVVSTIDRLSAQAQAAGISGTPSFLVGRTGGPLSRVQVTSLDPQGIRPALEQALRS